MNQNLRYMYETKNTELAQDLVAHCGFDFETADAVTTYYKAKEKLAIACGELYYGKDWIHNDIVQTNQIDCHGYAHSLPIASESLSIVYASHILQTYDWDAAYAVVLPEWRRVLKQGGILRISVPDFRMISLLYLREHKDLTQIYGSIFGKTFGPDGASYNKSTFDYKFLKEMLERSGFRKVTYWMHDKVENGNTKDLSSNSYILAKGEGVITSLNLECIKA